MKKIINISLIVLFTAFASSCGDNGKKDGALADKKVELQKLKTEQETLNGKITKSINKRQKNLWDQHIGTEVQLLQSKTNVETLQNQLKAVQAQVNTAQEQASQSNVYSDVNGTVDEVTAHVGETFNGNPLQGGYIKIVNKSDLKITVTIPENYASKVSKGASVMVQIPDVNKSFNSTITFLSQTIGSLTRGFTAEIKVPAGMALRPNQIALVNILDYSVPSTVAINV